MNLPPSETHTVSLIRRLAAMSYDGFVLIAIFFFATALLLPFTEGEAISSDKVIYSCYLMLWWYLFFVWFWTHNGQTIGMRAWKIQVQSNQQKALDWKSASIRFWVAFLSFACFGIGFIWLIFESRHRSWHDIASNTRLVRLVKKTET